MNRITVDSGGRFSVGDKNFVMDVSASDRRASTEEAFTIVKTEPYLRFYEELAAGFAPRSILELGIFQGGGYVLLDKLFRPHRMSAVDLSPKPVAPLLRYVAAAQGRFVHFSTSQADREMLRRIVVDELANELDLVVDDASHTYEQTRASFEVLFPLLQPGGIYIVEDWSWAHAPRYQSPDAHFAEQPALSNLLFQQIMLLASTVQIAEIQVRKFLYLIRKAETALRTDESGQMAEHRSIFDQILSRGRKWELI